MNSTEKDYWRMRAQQEKEAHARMYPGYKYDPRKTSDKKKRKSRKRQEASASAANHSMSATTPGPDMSGLDLLPVQPCMTETIAPMSESFIDDIHPAVMEMLAADAGDDHSDHLNTEFAAAVTSGLFDDNGYHAGTNEDSGAPFFHDDFF